MDNERRFLLKTLAGGVIGALALPALRATPMTKAQTGLPRSSGNSLTDLSAVDSVRLMRTGELSSEDYVSALIDAFNRNRHLNVFISRDDEQLLAAAREADKRRGKAYRLGPLHGLPVLLKDNIETAALPTSAGTPALIGRRTGRNAAVAQALFDAGALLAGKSNMNELAAGGDIGCVAGQALNPYNTRLQPGGSSTGNGAALAARLVPVAIGTDTGGSVRTPASLCGCTALRPTFGRYSGYGVMPISVSRDIPGPMARTIADLALLDGAITGGATELAPVDLRGLRLGIPRDYFYTILEPGIAAVIERALELLSGLGVELIEADIAGLEQRMTGLRSLFIRADFGRDVAGYLLESGDDITMQDFIAGICNPEIKVLFENPPDRATRAEARRSVTGLIRSLRHDYDQYFLQNRVDALIFPATVLTARPFGDALEVEVAGVSKRVSYSRNFMPGSTIGLPGVALPAGLSLAGLPVGLALDGPPGSDRRLLAISAAIEQALPPLPAPAAAG